MYKNQDDPESVPLLDTEKDIEINEEESTKEESEEYELTDMEAVTILFH